MDESRRTANEKDPATTDEPEHQLTDKEWYDRFGDCVTAALETCAAPRGAVGPARDGHPPHNPRGGLAKHMRAAYCKREVHT
jgi:hypothetical protein